MLNRKKRRDLVMPQDHLAFWIENKPNVEEPIFDFRMFCFCLGYDECVVLFGDFTQFFGLLTWNIDGALSRELDMIDVEYLIIESLQCSFGEGNEPDRKIKTGEP